MPDPEAFADTYGAWAVVVGGSEGIGSAFANELVHRGDQPGPGRSDAIHAR